MSNAAVLDQLDNAITLLLAEPDAAMPHCDWNIGELVSVAAELRLMPSPDFKARLRADLMRQAVTGTIPRNGHLHVWPAELRHLTSGTGTSQDVLPTLFGAGYGNYPMHRASFAASFAMHAVAMVLLLSSAIWIVQHRQEWKRESVAVLLETSPYVLPASPRQSDGGGGGGDASKLPASRGSLPRASMQQLAPPAIVVRNNAPRLPAAPTVVVPPNLVLSEAQAVGSPLSKSWVPSNGPGFAGGIGGGSGGGIGSGRGPGVGPGYGGGIGGGVYRVGGGVSAPRAIYAPDPEYSEEARKAKYQGTVVLWTVIGLDGRIHDLKVQRSLGMGLDQKAIEAVRKWRFEPAMKDGHPVAVQVNIEVNFRLY
jgi:periplasmic protein TonB